MVDVQSNGAQTPVEHLERALRSSRLIGAAIGMVMARRGVGYEEALEILKAQSSRTNVKLRDLCAQMVDSSAPPVALTPCPRANV